MQEVPSSPSLRDLLLRLATLESVAARGRAVITALTEATEAAEKSAARGEAAAEVELAKHRAQVDEQEEDIVSAEGQSLVGVRFAFGSLGEFGSLLAQL